MAKSKPRFYQNRTVSIPKPKLHLSEETKKGIAVIAFIALFFVTILSLFNVAGSIGDYVSKFLKFGFGFIAWFVPIGFLLISWSLARQKIAPDRPNHFYFRAYFGAFLLAG